jgi:hypothetical protein
MLLELFLQKELRKANVVQRIQQPFSNWPSVQQTKLANKEGSERRIKLCQKQPEL